MALGPSGVDSALYGFDELSYLLKGVFVASPHTTEGIEERRHLFVERIHKMADELERMVEEKEESRAMILVAVEGCDEDRDFPLLHVSSKGSKEMLVEAFKSIYIDERLKRALDEVLYRELRELERRNYI